MPRRLLSPLVLALISLPLFGASGDPQLKTDHPWYPGELSCSSFERLFKTQAELYTRVTGKPVQSDEDKALAAWFWRNLNYAHAEEGTGDYWDKGFGKGGDSRNREYWTGLFGHGFGLCGTTHSQWTVEMDALLGHCRGRGLGVTGHNSFEVYLTGGAYKTGAWALLDHDISTAIFSPDGSRLLSIKEVMADLKTLKNPNFKPERQRGWRVAGLHDDDAATYSTFACAEYLAGYAGAPPKVQLRAGESLRRYLKPGLDDGKTYVFWGMNYKAGGIPGLERSRSWVNQPEKMYGSKKGTGYAAGQVRFANAVYTYAPDFKSGAYKEGVIDENAEQVTFEFYTPFVIGCTPPNDKSWGIYDAGGKNGLIVSGTATCPVRISTDQGKTWTEPVALSSALDLTDHVKGHQQYWIRFGANAQALANAGIKLRTVCQCNVAMIPRIHDGDNKITFLSSGTGVLSAGPNKDQAEAHIVEGGFGQKTLTLELATPRKEVPLEIYAASWQSSGAPPGPTKFQIEYSLDKGQSWLPVVKDWQVIRRDPDPSDFWSQSMTYGNVKVSGAGETGSTPPSGTVRVRFKNDGGKQYSKAEAHLVYRVNQPGATEVTFAWKEADGSIKTANHVYSGPPGVEDTSWTISAGKNVETLWVDYATR